MNILAELSHFEQLIYLKYKVDDKLSKIEKAIIESIGIYEDGEIELVINGETILLNDIDDIKDIYILSKNYPTKNMPIGRPMDGKQRYQRQPAMNTKILLDIVKKHEKYSFMCELYYEQYKNDDIENDSLEKFIKRISKPTKGCFNLSQRANFRIKLIK